MTASQELRWGYTLTDLHAHAIRAARAVGTRATDMRTLTDTAWSAIAEHLYSAEHPPQPQQLTTVGRNAILDEEATQRRMRGLPPTGSRHDVAPRYAVHWQWAARHTPSHEKVVVDRFATTQILDVLPPRQREAIHAVAAHGDLKQAAVALAANYKTVVSNLNDGRRRFLSLWHEGETPSRRWMREKANTRSDGRRIMRIVRERNGTTRQHTPSPHLVPVHEGARCGSLTVIEPRGRGAKRVLCRCDCGTERLFVVANLRNSNTQSCGCPGGRRAAADRNRARRPLVVGGGNYPRTRSAARSQDRRAVA